MRRVRSVSAMTARTVNIELSGPSALRVREACRAGAGFRRVRIAWHGTARVAGAITRWFRAGQLGGDASIDLARWSGART